MLCYQTHLGFKETFIQKHYIKMPVAWSGHLPFCRILIMMNKIHSASFAIRKIKIFFVAKKKNAVQTQKTVLISSCIKLLLKYRINDREKYNINLKQILIGS